jgi:hypothetical protein
MENRSPEMQRVLARIEREMRERRERRMGLRPHFVVTLPVVDERTSLIVKPY